MKSLRNCYIQRILRCIEGYVSTEDVIEKRLDVYLALILHLILLRLLEDYYNSVSWQSLKDIENFLDLLTSQDEAKLDWGELGYDCMEDLKLGNVLDLFVFGFGRDNFVSLLNRDLYLDIYKVLDRIDKDRIRLFEGLFIERGRDVIDFSFLVEFYGRFRRWEILYCIECGVINRFSWNMKDVYYTPRKLVLFLVRCSFVEYFKNKLQHIKRLDDVLNEIFLIDDYIMGRMVMRDEELTIFRSVLPLFDKGLDIGDVAVGGGNFLVVVYDELNKLEYLLRGRDSFVSNLKNILRKNLFGLVGFDIDEKACTITKFRLMLKYIEHFYFWKDRIGTW